MQNNDDTGKNKYWIVRRRLIIATLAFCYLIIVFLILKGDHDSKLHESIMSGIMTIMVGTIVGYIGVAVYDDIADKDIKEPGKDFWRIRRRIVISNVVFTMGCITYLLLYGTDSRLNDTIVSDLALLCSIVIVSYIGGSSIQDKYMKKLK